MESTNISDYVHFDPEGPKKATIFESARMWSQVVCLDRNQTYGPVSDPASDAMVTIVAGEGVLLVDRKRRRLTQWGVALVHAGAKLTLTNASMDPLVVLLVTAPPPAA
ncbi:MAG TPA: hypothetical protein VGB51_02250 [Actinomycetota bacterium]